MYKANNYSRLVNGEIWICYITNQDIFKNIQRCFIANFHNFSIDIIHYKIFTHINSRTEETAFFIQFCDSFNYYVNTSLVSQGTVATEFVHYKHFCYSC